MTCTCGHLHAYAKGEKKGPQDPTHTLSLRNSFVAEMRKRFKGLNAAIQLEILRNDTTGLIKDLLNSTTPYPFTRSSEKISEFLKWLQRQIDDKILTVSVHPQLGQAIEAEWADLYIESAYTQGVRRAITEMRRSGYSMAPMSAQQAVQAVWLSPIHTDRVGVLFTRVFTDLQGITNDMSSQIARILAQGMIDGKNPRELASAIASVILTGGKTEYAKKIVGNSKSALYRGELIARTEIIRAHHLGMIQEYRNFGVAGVRVLAEWKTAGDDRVCTECASLEGKVFTLDEIEPLIPLHPLCRCIALPTVIEHEYI